jgi:hypothetical protein
VLSGAEGARLLEPAGISRITIGVLHDRFTTFFEKYEQLRDKIAVPIDIGALERLLLVLSFFLGSSGERIPDYTWVMATHV